MSHPLDEVFGFDIDQEGFEEIVIPDDPQLDHVIQFSLNEYKGIKTIIEMIEPRNRLKYFELMEKFLANAKDAMYKKEMIKVAQDRLKITKGTKGKAGGDGKEKVENLTSRNDMYRKLERVK